MVTKGKALSGGILLVLWVILMLVLCCSPKAHGATRQRSVMFPVTPAEIDQQFQWAYQAMAKTKPWICTSKVPSMIDRYFQRAYQDLGKTKPFIVTSNLAGDLNRCFDRLYMAINGGM